MTTNGHRLRVLVVDDERAVADSLATILRLEYYVVQSAYSAEEAVKVAEKFAPQVLISDVIMEELTGIDLAVYFARYHPVCRVLLMSGQIETAALLEEAMSRGHCPKVLAKPVHPEEILAFLASCAPAA
jgi:DNA-binding NtrC family response regulator